MKWMFGKTAMWMMATIAVATMAYAAAQDVQLPDGDGKKILETSCTACHGLDGVVKLHMDKDGWEGLISSMISNGAQVEQKDFPVLVDYLVKNFGPSAPQTAAGQQGQASNSDQTQTANSDKTQTSNSDKTQTPNSDQAQTANSDKTQTPNSDQTQTPNSDQAQASGSDADAKKILETACTACHDLDQVQDQHLSKDDWLMLVNSMIAKGASVDDKDVPVLVQYLSKTYGPKQ